MGVGWGFTGQPNRANLFRVGVFLDFVFRDFTTRAPHGAHVRRAKRNRIDRHSGIVVTITALFQAAALCILAAAHRHANWKRAHHVHDGPPPTADTVDVYTNPLFRSPPHQAAVSEDPLPEVTDGGATNSTAAVPAAAAARGGSEPLGGGAAVACFEQHGRGRARNSAESACASRACGSSVGVPVYQAFRDPATGLPCEVPRDPATGLPYEVPRDPATGLPYEVPLEPARGYAQGYDGQLTDPDYASVPTGQDHAVSASAPAAVNEVGEVGSASHQMGYHVFNDPPAAGASDRSNMRRLPSHTMHNSVYVETSPSGTGSIDGVPRRDPRAAVLARQISPTVTNAVYMVPMETRRGGSDVYGAVVDFHGTLRRPGVLAGSPVNTLGSTTHVVDDAVYNVGVAQAVTQGHGSPGSANEANEAGVVYAVPMALSGPPPTSQQENWDDALYASRAVQFHPRGGQFDFVWLSARTPHVGPQYVW